MESEIIIRPKTFKATLPEIVVAPIPQEGEP